MRLTKQYVLRIYILHYKLELVRLLDGRSDHVGLFDVGHLLASIESERITVLEELLHFLCAIPIVALGQW